MKLSLCIVVLLISLSCCEKDTLKFEDNISLVDAPLLIIQVYSRGTFKIKYIKSGFTQIRDTIENAYLTITNDSIIQYNKGQVFRSKLTWKQITNARQKKTYAMVYTGLALPPGLCPEQVESGLLILVEDGVDPTGYYLERQ